ncbi:MAG: ATP-binding domain-containing protein, partial [Alcanivorax sp.]|nr:ATP-binding domain-containing protein [Alcanivorax sp.]
GLALPLLEETGREEQNGQPHTLLRVAFQLPDGRIKWVLPSRLDGVETVYAMTVHKSQGSEFNHALLVLPDTPHPLLTRELIYTAVTRARQHFTLLEYGPPAVLNQAVARATRRASGLSERLITP